MIRDFVKQFGGPTKLARDLSEFTGKRLNRPQVAMWVTRDNVPWEWRADVVRFARSKQVAVPSEISNGVVIVRASA